jgi:hypothetical protein
LISYRDMDARLFAAVAEIALCRIAPVRPMAAW